MRGNFGAQGGRQQPFPVQWNVALDQKEFRRKKTPDGFFSLELITKEKTSLLTLIRLTAVISWFKQRQLEIKSSCPRSWWILRHIPRAALDSRSRSTNPSLSEEDTTAGNEIICKGVKMTLKSDINIAVWFKLFFNVTYHEAKYTIQVCKSALSPSPACQE